MADVGDNLGTDQLADYAGSSQSDDDIRKIIDEWIVPILVDSFVRDMLQKYVPKTMQVIEKT